MCGIAGIWRFGEPVTGADERDIRRMTDAIAHRGPDGEGYRIGRDIALGHRRLAILDTSDRAAQPMATPDGTGTLVYNGEVYNYPEIRAELERDGIAFASTGDAEVVLHALHHWGPEAAVPKFNGMFALAYHDSRSSTLWLARDRLGIKPMSLARSHGRLLFASEDKAVLAASDTGAGVDARALTLRLMRLSAANGSSLMRGVERLRPGTLLRCSGGDCREIVWWEPLAAFDAERLLSDRRDDAEKTDTLRELFETSVGMHLAADTPVAACLSGGVDSGMITSIASRRIAGFSAYVADPDEGPNEVAAASANARRAGAALHPVGMDRDAYLRTWPLAVYGLETMNFVFSDMALLAIAERSRRDGIPVLLTGEGSDELFGGYARHKATGRMWRRAGPPWSWFLSRKSRERLRRNLETSPFDSSPIMAGYGRRALGLECAAPHETLVQTACARAVSAIPGHRDRGILAASLYDLVSHMQELLNRQDRLGMIASVEMRVPFIENRLIDFAMHLPARDLYRYRTSKYLLKQVAKAYVPKRNIDSRKLGFPLTGDYSAGSEALLRDGLLRDALAWSRLETEAALHHAAASPVSRNWLVAAELFARMFTGDQKPDELGEQLVAAAHDSADRT